VLQTILSDITWEYKSNMNVSLLAGLKSLYGCDDIFSFMYNMPDTVRGFMAIFLILNKQCRDPDKGGMDLLPVIE